MSRCFPFPPPGYEKKIKTEEADLLTKEKQKEKKHKKDKKGKEKKEGKDKTDKERSKDKHKERKDKKDKHKDRKDKDRDKEKSRTSEEKKTEVPLDTRDTEKLVRNTLQNGSSGDSRFVQDLARRIRDGETAMGRSSEKKTKVSEINARVTETAVEHNGSYPVQETNHRGDYDKRVHPQRNFSVAKNDENVVPGGSFGSNHKRAEGMGKPVDRKDWEKQMESVEKNQHKESIKSDRTRDKEGIKKSESKDTDRTKEKKEEKTEVINKVGQEKPKFIEGGPRLKERDKDVLDTRNSKPPDPSRASNKNITGDGILGKRKELERNGFFYENGSNRPNKLQRPFASPISLALENGRKLGTTKTDLQSVETNTPPKPASELNRGEAKTPPKSSSELKHVETITPLKSAPELPGTSCKLNVKEHRVNGFIGTQEPKVVLPNSFAATGKVKIKENGEASVKPPHPDLKYLNQILKIPEREELSQFDDQEWLLGDPTVKVKKPKTESPASDETLQVWDRAFRIESADIVALPYVIPL